MAVKHTAEVTISDLTDAYSVQLSGYGYSFPGTATGAALSGSTTTTASAYCGAVQVDCSITQADITKPTGISATVSKATGSMSPVVTITASSSFTKANSGKVIIPVTVSSPDGDLTFTMDFSVTVSEKGATPNITASKSGTVTTILADGTQIATISDGTNGTNGLNQATVYLYKRANDASKPSSGTSTYTFSTGVLASVPSGWSQTFPAETQGNTTPVWMMCAIASSNTATDTIGYSEWTTPVKMVSSGSNGTNGTDGAAGYNQATVFLYQRASSAPSKPSSSVTYTFSTGALSSTPSGWSRSVPSGDNPCYVTQAACVSQSDTYSITSSSWTSPTKLVEDGEDGDDPYTLSITSNNGIILKNNTGSTTLTVHIFREGAELGSVPSGLAVKWYKDGTYLSGKDGLTLTVNASDVANKSVYLAKLEG